MMKKKYLHISTCKGTYYFLDGIPCFTNAGRLCSVPFRNDKRELCAYYYADNLSKDEYFMAMGRVFVLKDIFAITFEEWKQRYRPANIIEYVKSASSIIDFEARPNAIFDYVTETQNRKTKKKSMNKQRRQQLYDATAALDEAVAVIQDIHSEEDDAFNNLSEGLQCSRTGESMQEAMETLDGFVDEIESIKGKIEKFAENKK